MAVSWAAFCSVVPNAMGLPKNPPNPIVPASTTDLPLFHHRGPAQGQKQMERVPFSVFGFILSFGLSLWYLNGIGLSSPAPYTHLQQFKGVNELPV